MGSRLIALSYGGLNRLSSHTDTAGLPRSLSYDARGNVTALGGLGFTYDASNQPVAAYGAVTGTYVYDGHKRRVKQVVSGETRYSVYDVSGGLVGVDQVGAGPTEYIRASGMTLARVAGASVTWLHPDHLGSAVAGTGTTGSVVWRESEQPFGEDWVSAAANDNQAGYTGHIEDAATGLVYMQARYYDPIIGRFLANDPVGFTPGRPDMFNRYAYAGNDPLNQVDPDGKCAGPLIVPCAVGVWEGGTALVTLLGAAVILTSDSVGSEDDPVPVLRPSDGLPIRDGATLERPGEKGRADQIYGKPGGIDEANEDFDQIAEPDSIQDRGEGIRTGKTKNGDSVTVRPNSNDGRATVDVSRGNKGNRETDKYRYGEKKPPAKPNKGETQRVRRTDNQ